MESRRAFTKRLGKNPVPSSSQDLITVTGGRREKSFSLSFRGLGEKKDGKLIFLNCTNRKEKKNIFLGIVMKNQ